METHLIMNDALKLIIEPDILDYEVILEKENEKSPSSLKIKGPYIVCEKRNTNGRLYKNELMDTVVENYQKDYIDGGRSFGELGHPQSPEINGKDVCHRVMSLVKEGDQWIGTSVVLCSSPDGKVRGTPNGDILASILQYGGKPGMSTRGVGKIRKDGLVERYKLIAPDVVNNPSADGCFVNGILESKSFMIDQYGSIVEMAYEKLEKDLSTLPTKIDEKSEKLVRVIREFIQNI